MRIVAPSLGDPFVGWLPKYNTSRREYGRRVAQRARYQPPGSKGRVKLLGPLMLKKFKATIKIGGRSLEVVVEAKDTFQAKAMINAQYGNPQFVTFITEVRR